MPSLHDAMPTCLAISVQHQLWWVDGPKTIYIFYAIHAISFQIIWSALQSNRWSSCFRWNSTDSARKCWWVYTHICQQFKEINRISWTHGQGLYFTFLLELLCLYNTDVIWWLFLCFMSKTTVYGMDSFMRMCIQWVPKKKEMSHFCL